MAFTMTVSKFEKSHCLLKSSLSLPRQPNLIKTLATGAISKLMTQTRESNPFINPPQSCQLLMNMALQTWCICHKFFISLTNYFVMVFKSCGKWLGWNILQRLSSRKSNKNFYISNAIKLIVVFHVNMLQQLHLPVKLVIRKHEKIPSKIFNLFNIANNNTNSTFKLKRKLEWCLELIPVM